LSASRGVCLSQSTFVGVRLRSVNLGGLGNLRGLYYLEGLYQQSLSCSCGQVVSEFSRSVKSRDGENRTHYFPLIRRTPLPVGLIPIYCQDMEPLHSKELDSK
jgi:hypothetical protein